MTRQQENKEKQKYWKKMIREAARSDMSISEFCRQRRLKEKQFYWWRRKLRRSPDRAMRSSKAKGKQASFALVSDGDGSVDAGIELLLGDGRRLRISKGVDEATLRAVLAAVGSEGC